VLWQDPPPPLGMTGAPAILHTVHNNIASHIVA
jgi:hypothetical protein